MTCILFGMVGICCSRFKWNYLKNEKEFLNFFINFLNLHPILNILKKNMIFIAIAFPKLQTMKGLIRPLSKNRCFTTPFESQHVKRPETLVKSAWGHFYHLISSLQGKLVSKTTLLVMCQILRVDVMTLTADDKYPVPDCKNLLLLIQRQLS